MARTRGHGGSRTPAKPAPVSGPGALSRRTDSQPVRSFPAEQHGQRQALADQQTAAPLAAGAPAPRIPSGAPVPARPDIFGATARPGESPLAGATGVGGAGTNDPDLLLRAIYRRFPDPRILRLIRRGP